MSDEPEKVAVRGRAVARYSDKLVEGPRRVETADVVHEGLAPPRRSAGVLSEDERGVLLGLVRDGLRKVARNRRNAKVTYGEKYDPRAHDTRTALLRSAYTKLGGDPSRITNLDRT